MYTVIELESLKDRFTAGKVELNDYYRIWMTNSRSSVALRSRKAMDLKSLFDSIDKRSCGYIETPELEAVVKRFIPSITPRQLRKLVQAADANVSGVLQKQDFIAFFG